MALTGTLLADFSAFVKEAGSASFAVKGLQTSANDAAVQLSKIGEGVDIKSTISDPMGTATTVATKFAESLGTLGVAATGIVAVGTALFELTEKAAAAGGALNDMGERTGMSVVKLSQYSAAIKVAGGSMDTVADAFFKLSKGIGDNSDKVSQGLNKIGISFDDLKAAGPDQYLELIAAGFAATEDPAMRAAASADIFRDKTGQMIPVLLKLNDGLLATNDITPWTDEQAKDAEKFDMQITSMKVHAEAFAVSLGRDLIPAVGGFIDAAKPAASWLANWVAESSGLPGMARIGADAIGWMSAAYDTFKGKTELPIKINVDTEEAKKKLKDLEFDAARTPDKLVAAWKAANAGVKMDDLQTALGNLNEMLGDTDNVTMEQVEANLKLKNAFAELASAGDGWKGTVDTIDGSVVESIVSARAAGVSMQALGVIYSDLTETQKAGIEKLIAARAKQATETQKQLDAQAKLEAKTIDETTKLWDAYEVERTKQMGTVTDIAKAENLKQYNDAAANANKMGIVDAQYWDALEARWKQKNAAIGIDWAALTNAATTQSKAGLQQIADGAQATYQEALKHVGEWSDASIDKFRTTAEAAQKAADMFGTSWADNADKAKKKVDEMAASTIGSIHAIAAASASATIPAGATSPYPDTVEGRLKQLADEQARYGPGTVINTSGLFGGLRDSGGPVTAGTSYLIGGGKAPELFTPGASGFVTPNAAGGGGVVQHIYVTQPLGTPDAIARAVADAQIALMKGQGARLPYGG